MGSIADQLTKIVNDEVYRRASKAVERVVNDQRQLANKLTGNMAASTSVQAQTRLGHLMVWRLWSRVPYSLYQDQGTGIHGPLGREIVALEVGNRRRVFRMPLMGGVVFRPSHRGTLKTEFFSKPLLKWPEYLRQEFA